jgi:hypothetical protein
MAHTTLPAAHSEADAILAQQVGRRLQLRELHVFWTLPVEETERAEETAPPRLSLISAFAALGSLLERLGERLAQTNGATPR